MSRSVNDLIEKYYGQVVIGQRALDARIRRAITDGHTRVLDAGCGWDAPLTRKYGDQAWVVGMDISRNLVKDLKTLCGDLSALPFRDGSFTLIFSKSVFEHLTEPEKVLKEFHRVLQPGGQVVILTPNKYDYSSVVAALTPQVFHEYFINKVYGVGAYDTFPTVYRANTPIFWKQLAAENGWKIKELRGIRHYPANLMFSRLLFMLGIAYDWLIAKLKLHALQPSLLVCIEKE